MLAAVIAAAAADLAALMHTPNSIYPCLSAAAHKHANILVPAYDILHQQHPRNQPGNGPAHLICYRISIFTFM